MSQSTPWQLTPSPTNWPVLGALAFLLALALTGCGKSDDDLIKAAKASLAKDDRAGATIQLKNAIQANDKSAEARFMLGKVLQEGGTPAQAEIELRRALELGHPAQQVVPVLARALLQLNQAARISAAYAETEWPAEPQASADLKVSLANAYLAQKSVSAAATAVAAALRLKPDYEPALLLQARMAAIGGDIPGALGLIDSLLAKAPKSGDAWILKGDLLMNSSKDRAPAIAAYQQAVAAKPSAGAAHGALITLFLAERKVDEAAKQLEQMKAALPQTVQTAMYDGQVSFAKGDLKRAREQFQLVLRALPTHVPTLQTAGMVELGLNSLAQAEAMLSKAVQLAPDAVGPRSLLAQAQLRQNQPVRAIATLAPALDKANPPVQLLLLGAQANMAAGESKRAEALFQRAAKAAPNDPKIRTAVALGHLSKGSPDAVVAELQAISASDTGVSADLGIIATLLHEGKNDAARKAIDNLARKTPDKPMADLLRGQLQVREKNLADARKSFAAAVAKDPKYYPAVAALGGLDIIEKHPELAKARFTDFLKASPGHLQASMALAEVAQRSGGSRSEVAALIEAAIKANPSEVRPRIVLVDWYLAGGDIKAALAAAQTAATALPDDAEVQERLGQTMLASGDKQQAQAAYNRLVALQPKSPTGYLGLADVAMALGEPAGAARQVRKALEVAPDAPIVQRAAIQSALIDKHPEQAFAVARQVQTKRPGEALGYTYEGDIALQQKQWPVAEAAFRKALGKPGGETAASRIHVTLKSAGKTAEAEQWSATWRKDHPNDVLFLYYLGDEALARDDQKSAEQWYRTVVERQPGNALALNNIAYLMMVQKRPGALAMSEKAVQAAPDQPQLLDTLALAQAGEGQLSKGLATAERALSLAPKDGGIRLTLARLYLQNNDKAKAKAELDKLATLGPAFAKQSEVGRLLKELGG